MPEAIKQATLAECNAAFMRQALPQTYGNKDEAAAAVKAAKQADADAAKAVRDAKVASDTLYHEVTLRGHTVAPKLTAAAAEQAAPEMTAAEQAALDELNKLT